MVNVQKKLDGSNHVLAAFTIDNGVAIGCKKSGGRIAEGVVILKGTEDGRVNLYINMDRLQELNGQVVFKKFEDELEPAVDRMNIRDYLKIKGWACDKGRLGRWQSVNVGFLTPDGMEDEVQFDIQHACTKAGEDELFMLFSEFCKENHYKTNSVIYVSVVKTANTYNGLVED